jgi:predicted ABC-type ATPase
MPVIYLVAGCNGAGKSTASFSMLPEILKCKEFINADNIAAGLSPFQPESVSFEAGRVMLKRIDQLVRIRVDFAIETTLSSRNYLLKVPEWKKQGYQVIMVYFWLINPELALERINDRVKKGGHSVSNDIVLRRYYRGIKNLFDYFIPVCDYWLIVDNSTEIPVIICEGINDLEFEVFNLQIWTQIKGSYK